jgi:UDPglucose 6-dehydrogenase
MSVESAEMTKHAINAFLATSVAFANEIASICELVGADAKEVERGLKSEHRIGPKAYLSPGAAFAGGTLARDIQFLSQTAAQRNLPIPLLSSVKLSNDEHKNWIRRCLQAKFSTLNGCTIAVWGLTYKPGTNTLRRSLSVELCNWLLAEGAYLQVHDPEVVDLPDSWTNVTRRSTPLEVLDKADALIVATEWPQYKEIQPHHLTKIRAGLVVVDANRFLQHLNVDELDYIAVGSWHPMRS